MKIEKVNYCERCNGLVEYCVHTKPAHVLCFKHLHFGVPDNFKPLSLTYVIPEDKTYFSFKIDSNFKNQIKEGIIILKGRLKVEPTIFNLYVIALKYIINKKENNRLEVEN